MDNIIDTPNRVDVDPDKVLPENVRREVESKLFNDLGQLNKDVSELSKEDQEAFKAQAFKDYLMKLSDKRKFKMGFKPEGFRAGFTKPTIESRKKDRRVKNKTARAARKVNCKKR